MTIKEFFESNDKLAIHCNTKEKAKELLKAFDREGYEWFSEDRYIEDTCWITYEEKTCYDNLHKFAGIDLYQCRGYTILEFEDIEDIEVVEEKPDLSQFTTDELLKEIMRRVKA